MARWLVTGATGCVGRATVAAARSAGHDVVGLARRAAEIDAPLVVGRIEDAAAIERATQGRDVVVHLAGWVHRLPETAADQAALRTSIIEGTRHVARAARAARARLIAASTVAVHETTPYGRAKLEAEKVVRELCPDALLLRIVHVYGPHDRGNMAALAQAVASRRAVVVGDGENKKSMVYVDNLADRVVLGAERRVAGTFVASDGAPTQREILAALTGALGRRPLPRVPLAAARLGARLLGGRWPDRVEKLAATTAFDGGPLDTLLDYRPRISLDEGMRRELEWLCLI